MRPVHYARLRRVDPDAPPFRQFRRRQLGSLIGRDRELTLLIHALDDSLRGRGRFVVVRGDAGVGKTRLVFEFIEAVRGDAAAVVECNFRPSGLAHPLGAMACVVRAIVHATDGAAAPNGDAARRRLGGLGIVAEDRVAPILALLDEASAPESWRSMDPPGRLSRTVDAVTALIFAAARERPQIIVLEDLHWADAEGRAFVDALAAGIVSSPVLVLATLRDYHNGLTLAPRRHVSECALRQFTAPESEQFLAELMGTGPALGRLKDLLVRKTQGNPFFLEESVRALLDTGALSGRPGALTPTHDAVGFAVPDSVRAVIADRIDALPDAERSLLFHAAVLGQGFDIAVLQQLAGLSREQLFLRLEQLQLAGFVQRTRVVPNMEYSFRHALIHDVAYATLLRRKRRELHGRALGVIRRRPRDRVHGRTQLLAHHAHVADEVAAAYVYGRAAGLEAQARSRNQEARDHLANALAALEKCRPTLRARHAAVDLRLEFAQSLFSLGQTKPAQSHLEDAHSLAADLGDQRRLGNVLANMTLHYWIGGQLTRAIDSQKAALRVARSHGDREQEISSVARLGVIMADSGDHAAATRVLTEATRLMSSDIRQERYGLLGSVMVVALGTLSVSLGDLGRFVAALDTADRAVAIAEEGQHGFSLAYAHLHAGTVLIRKGDFQRAIPSLERALATARDTRSELLVPVCQAGLGHARACAYGWHEGYDLLEEAIGDLEHHAVGKAAALSWFAEARLDRGQWKHAKETTERAVLTARENEERAQEAWATCLLGEVCLSRTTPCLPKAEALIRRAMAVAEARSLAPLSARCALGLAKLHWRTGQSASAQGAFDDAGAQFARMGMTHAAETARARWRARDGATAA